MSYRVKIEAMPGNPAANRVGVQTGLWRVVVEDWGTGSVIPRNPPRQVLAENLSYDEAREMIPEINKQLNG